MKKIIRNRMYDTDTARVIGYHRHSNPSDFHYYIETLYCKRTGEYFLHGEGGPASRYATQIGMNEWSGGSKITPLDFAAARDWAEDNLDPDVYVEEFGEPSEDESCASISISLPVTTIDALKRRAKELGISVSALVAPMIKL